jgi:hypothetical protein
MSKSKPTKNAKEEISKAKAVSYLRDPIAIVCSDLHLSQKPPACRIIPEGHTWRGIQESYLKQLGGLQKTWDIPVIYAGDIFDKPNPPAELVNHVIEQLPEGWAIAGQHDLPYHNYDDIKKSGLWTLVLADKVSLLDPGIAYLVNEDLYAVGYPWGWADKIIHPEKVQTPVKSHSEKPIYLAVIHSYIYTKSTCYRNPPPEARWNKWIHRLKGYDAAVFGDNHQGFSIFNGGHCPIFNCGTFMRRKADEINYTPQVGLLFADGHFESHYLDTSDDKFIDSENLLKSLKIMEEKYDFHDFVNELSSLSQNPIDFIDTLKRALTDSNVSSACRNIILRALEPT